MNPTNGHRRNGHGFPRESEHRYPKVDPHYERVLKRVRLRDAARALNARR